MNRHQANLLTTAHAVSAELKTITATNLSPALQAAQVALDNLRTAIADAADAQERPLPPRTRLRDQQFDAAARATYRMARLLRGHALDAGLVALAGELDVPLTHFTAPRFMRRLQRMREVQASVHTHASALAALGITPALIADFDAKLATADEVVVAPRVNIVARRVATTDLARALAKLEQLLHCTLDPLMELHAATDPAGYARYRDARRVINLPGRPAVEPAAPESVTPAAPAASAPLGVSQPLAA